MLQNHAFHIYRLIFYLKTPNCLAIGNVWRSSLVVFACNIKIHKLNCLLFLFYPVRLFDRGVLWNTFYFIRFTYTSHVKTKKPEEKDIYHKLYIFLSYYRSDYNKEININFI